MAAGRARGHFLNSRGFPFYRVRDALWWSVFLCVLAAWDVASAQKVDKHPEKDCACWAAQGNCKTNPGFMLGSCGASCEKQIAFEAYQSGEADSEKNALETAKKDAEAREKEALAKITELEARLTTQEASAQSATSAAEEEAKTSATRVAELEQQLKAQVEVEQQLKAQVEASGADSNAATSKIAELQEQVRVQTQLAEQASVTAAEASKTAARIAELEEEIRTQTANAEVAQASAAEESKAVTTIAELEEQLRARTQEVEQASQASTADAEKSAARIAQLEEQLNAQTQTAEQASQASTADAEKSAARIAQLEEQLNAQTQTAEQASQASTVDAEKSAARIAQLEEQLNAQTQTADQASQALTADAEKSAARIAQLEERLNAQTQTAEEAAQASAADAGKAVTRIAELEEQLRAQTQDVHQASQASTADAEKSAARIAQLEEQLNAQTQTAEQAVQASAAEADKAATSIAALEEQLRTQAQAAEQARSDAQKESSSLQTRITELEGQVASQRDAQTDAEALHVANAKIAASENEVAETRRALEQAKALADEVGQANAKCSAELEAGLLAQQESSATAREISELQKQLKLKDTQLQEQQAKCSADSKSSLRPEMESASMHMKTAGLQEQTESRQMRSRKDEEQGEDWLSTYSQLVVETTLTTISQMHELLGNETVENIKDKASFLKDGILVALEYANYSYALALEQGNIALEHAEPTINTIHEYTRPHVEPVVNTIHEFARPHVEYARPHVDAFLVEASVYIEAICFAFFSAAYPGSFAILFWALIVLLVILWYSFRMFLRGCCCCCCRCTRFCRFAPCRKKENKSASQQAPAHPTDNGDSPIKSSPAENFFIGDDDEILPSSPAKSDAPPEVKCDTLISGSPIAMSPTLIPSPPANTNHADLAPPPLANASLEPPSKTSDATPPVLPAPKALNAGSRDSGDALGAPPQGHVSALVSKAEARAKSSSSPTSAVAPLSRSTTPPASRIEEILERIEEKVDGLVETARSQPDLGAVVKEAVKAVVPLRQPVVQNHNQRLESSLSV